MKFFDRVHEMRALRQRHSRSASFGLVYGQRRIGKTWLLKHLADGDSDTLFFVADESTSPALLRRFHAAVAARGLGGPAWSMVAPMDWSTSLSLLLQSAAAANRRLVFILDEVQYLFAADPAVPSILQRLWDEFHTSMPLHIVLCGSALGTLSTLGDIGQPLHGRFDLRMKLQPFGYREAAEFAAGWAPVDHLRMYGVFGGLARHLAEIDAAQSLADNAIRAILGPLAPLHEAPLDLLRTEHLSAHAEANAILAAIAAGENQFGAIAARAGLKGPRVAYVLAELQALDIIERQVRHGDKPGAKFARYRCRDPFVRFWFRHLPSHRLTLIGGDATSFWHDHIGPRLDDHMGAVFEDIVGQAITAGTIPLGEVRGLRPYWSRNGQTELDWVVDTPDGLVFVECKWRPHGRVGVADMGRLRGHIERSGYGGQPHRCCLATAGSFTPELRALAAAEGTLLVTAPELFA